MKRGVFILFTYSSYGKVDSHVMKKNTANNILSYSLFVLLCFLSCCLLM